MLPRGVPPGASLQMVPERQVIHRHGGPLKVKPLHPMANGLNVLANANAIHLRKYADPPIPYTAPRYRWGKNYVVHSSEGSVLNHDKLVMISNHEVADLPVAFKVGEAHLAVDLLRCCCWPNHPLALHIFDDRQNEVMSMRRDCVCGCSLPCLLCNNHKLRVRLGDGTPLGSVEQRTGIVCFQRTFEVRNNLQQVAYTLDGSLQCAPNCICRRYMLHIRDAKGEIVGHLENHYKGLCQTLCCGPCCCFGNTCCANDQYTVSYPPEATVEDKMLLLASNLLVDFMLFQ